ncbi:MAG: DUF3422 domain-containing protein [Microvirga sp.]|nr:DUF3422 domain-containing protein [Microvirga sp.]
MSGSFLAHPLRGRVLAELHARPFTPIDAPRRILHFAFMTDEAAANTARDALAGHCRSLGVEPPDESARHHRAQFSGATLRWEGHSEFTTYTWEFPCESPAGAADSPFRPGPESLAAAMRGLSAPGLLMVAVDLHILPAAAHPEGPQKAFGDVNLAVAEVEGGAALIATDFKPDAEGYVRILILDRSLTRAQAGSLVQRVLEIETYRTMALLGLPEAQALAPSIRRIETALPGLVDAMRESAGFEDNRLLLDQLTSLAAELESAASASLYRFGATRAYDELVRLRLAAVEESAVPGFDSWSDFLARRLRPAMRTCMSTEERQANLSRKLTRATQLLRARVEVELESQNGDLLRAMNARARTQLRLQQTVEGLSVAAMTYYISALVYKLLEGVNKAVVPVDPTVATAVAIPFILIGLALVVRHIRRSHRDGDQ